jgi:HPt (histidine-containing phosphotransfer) domain-containing protein
MSVQTNQQGQLIILMVGDINSIQPSFEQEHQTIITANKLNDIISHITTTKFDLILLDLTVSDLNFITRIKDPDCINNKTPLIALVNQAEDLLNNHYPIEFAGNLIKPITKDQLNNFTDPLRTKSLAFNYIQLILNKTKNNQRLALTIFEKLFEELPMQIIGIKAALETRQYDLAHEITHKLNGSVSFCDLMDIQHPAKALESSLLKKDIVSLNQHFLTLQQNTLNFTRHQKPIMAYLEKILQP